MSLMPSIALLDNPAVANAMSILFDATIKGSALLALAWLVTRAFRGASAAAKHLVWCAALGGMVMIPVLSSVVPRIPLRVLQPIAGVSERTRQAPRAVVELVSPRARTIGTSSPAPTRFDAARVVPAIWLAITMLVLLRIALGAVRVWLWARRAHPVAEGSWLSLAQHIADQLHIARPVRLLRSERACVPMTWGVVYPTVLLPADADEWTADRRTIVLLHEFAHVKRLDAFTQLMAQMVVAIFWFNPLVWLAARHMRTEREHACDDFVLEGGARATDYAYDLLQIARSLGGDSIPVAALAMARPSELEGRLLAILDPQTNHRGVSRARLGLATLGVLALALPLAAFAPAEPAFARRAPMVYPLPSRTLLDTSRKMPSLQAPRATTVRVETPRAIAAPDRETLIAVAKSAMKMTSDYEKAELLLTIAKYYVQDDELCGAYLDVVSSIASDHDRGRTLLPMLTTAGLPASSFSKVIAATTTLQSDYSRGQIIAAIAAGGDLSNRQIIELVGATSTMASSYEKANALVAIARQQPLTDADVRKAILKTAETITASTDYRRVVSMILK